MKKGKIFIPLAVLICLLLVAGAMALPVEFSMGWWTADGGGGQSTDGEYILRGTIGQPDGGVLHGDQYSLAGGFWGGPLTEPPPGNRTYLPVVWR
jgi:hypothetical protein